MVDSAVINESSVQVRNILRGSKLHPDTSRSHFLSYTCSPQTPSPAQLALELNLELTSSYLLGITGREQKGDEFSAR